MKVALEVWSSEYDQVESTCLLAESLGLDACYYGESPNDLNLDCWTTLAALARATEQIRLGPVITNILSTYRSHLLLAKQAETVATISRGRVDFRTGVGASATFGRPWWEPMGVEYPDYDQRLSELRRALELVPRLWDEKSDLHRIPITIAATGERAMRLAAFHADVWETSFCTPDEFAGRKQQFDVFAGRRQVVHSLEIDGFVSQSEQGLARVLERVQTERGKSENLDAVLERALIGVPAEAVVRLGELEAAGVDQVVVALHDPHDPDAIEALAATAQLLRSRVRRRP